ncbi:MAG: amidophosphoribosyltransferase [Clostridia bacterium]|nr:amidophosphoribosyltransferase [Clostridia bacterium]
MTETFKKSLPIDDSLHEECGVFGVYGCSSDETAEMIYHGLFALQHRGQESCGIAVNDNGTVSYERGMGLVSEVFHGDKLSKLNGQMGIGHVRYSSLSDSIPTNTQPLVIRYSKGSLSIANNGSLVNANRLRDELSQNGAIFQTTVDSEVIAYTIARERLNCGKVEDAVIRAMKKLEGAYSLLVMSPKKLIAARDPKGFHPLCIGQRDDGAYVFASESCALYAADAKFIRDVKPGEVVVASENGLESHEDMCTGKPAHCIFEWIYFARPDSVIEGVGVHESRLEAGKLLAQQYPVDADIVIGVPESGNDAAMGYARESGLQYSKGFVKNNYIGRTFIRPRQSQRENAVKIKLHVCESTVKGKRVVMLDDSIVRGTTCARLVRMLKDAGAKEVHVRISSPPFLWPCYFGTDVHTKDSLSAVKYSIEEIRQQLDADSLGYLDIDSLHKILCGKELSYCDACFTGNYPVDVAGWSEDAQDFIK